LAKIREWEKLPDELEKIISRGRTSFRESLAMSSQMLIPLVEKFSAKYKDDEFSKAASHLTQVLKSDFEEIPLLTGSELTILQKIFAAMPASSLQQIEFSSESVLQNI
jgi:hypothetical protein